MPKLKQRVSVQDRQRTSPADRPIGWGQFMDILTEEIGLSVQAAWKFYEGDLLYHRDCTKTHVLRDSKRGPIFVIYHEDRKGAQRPCPECNCHSTLTCYQCLVEDRPDFIGIDTIALKLKIRVHLRKFHDL